MSLRLVLGLVGMLLACIGADINQEATSLALADIRGAFGYSVDQGSWFTTLYSIGAAMGMLVAPWLAMTFSVRRFAAVAAVSLGLLGLACAATESRSLLLMLRWCQGLTTGFLIPLLMMVALRFLTPALKLFGLAAYGLTATFAPNIAMPVVAWAHHGPGIGFVFWAVLPLCLVASGLILHGLPQDPPRLARWRQFDWLGWGLGWALCASVVTLFAQGERLDWLHSPLIRGLALASLVLLPLFLWRCAFGPAPLIRPQLLRRVNFGFGVCMLVGVIALGASSASLPAEFLAEVQGYRPLQSLPVTLAVALPPLMILPLAALVLNVERIDSRWIMASGLLLMAAASWSNSHVTLAWMREQFYVAQVVFAIGQSMVVVGLLMTATAVVDPMEGPFASATINTSRALAGPVAGGLIGHYLAVAIDRHAHALMERLGTMRFSLMQSAPLSGHGREALSWPMGGPGGEALLQLHERIDAQATVLAYADAWRLMALLALLLVPLCLLPKRTHAPRFNRPRPI
ncbi:EmrB/QacA family drug resistance transporter [Halomonas sp. ND22Bw]|uniref:MFS transporter n=1 Tax=Halomonas sp. ND22Bw TaxID=2054178 RepID=UPI000D0B97D2|nr:EmrB/QacA family drug resistance transporter [Halomonas sp. ND22Bw]